MRQKLNLITLGVTDIKASIRFYENGLGWKRSDKSMEELILFPLGGITLALFPLKELEEDVTLKYQATTFSGCTLSFNAKSEEEVNQVMQQAMDAGAVIVKPAQNVSWGGYSGYFSDPDGYLFEVAYNPFWPLDEKDNLVL